MRAIINTVSYSIGAVMVIGLAYHWWTAQDRRDRAECAQATNVDSCIESVRFWREHEPGSYRKVNGQWIRE